MPEREARDGGVRWAWSDMDKVIERKREGERDKKPQKRERTKEKNERTKGRKTEEGAKRERTKERERENERSQAHLLLVWNEEGENEIERERERTRENGRSQTLMLLVWNAGLGRYALVSVWWQRRRRGMEGGREGGEE